MRTRLAAILLCIVSVPGVIAQTVVAQTVVAQTTTTTTKSGFFKTSDGISIHYLEAGRSKSTNSQRSTTS